MRIGIDIGGVISKYPHIFRDFINELHKTNVEVYIITDMPLERAVKMLSDNDIILPSHDNILSADYEKYGENCKAVLCKERAIDIFFDDHVGYLANAAGAPVRAFVMPDPNEPYFHDEWVIPDNLNGWGRRKPEWKLGV